MKKYVKGKYTEWWEGVSTNYKKEKLHLYIHRVELKWKSHQERKIFFKVSEFSVLSLREDILILTQRKTNLPVSSR